MADFKKLRVWKKAHALALCAHEVALSIRGSQYASLRNQIIRSSMSIPANIVEGREQKTDPEFCRFLRYALGSTSELEYHMIIARDIKVIKPAQFVEVLTPLKGSADASVRAAKMPGPTQESFSQAAGSGKRLAISGMPVVFSSEQKK